MRSASTGANISAYSAAVTGGTQSTSTSTGALVVTGGAGISGNLYVGGTFAPSTITSTTLTVSTTSSLGATTTTTLVASSTSQLQSLGVGTAASGTSGEIRATNAITAYYSDRRLKGNVETISNALDKVEQLTGITYTQNEVAEQYGYNDYSRQVGVFAQDVQAVQPEAVKPAPFDIAEDGSSKSGEYYLTVQYDKLVPLLIEAIKELRQEINQLKGL